MSVESRLKQVLESGQFAVTAECGPPRGADPAAIRRKAGILKGKVDAVNVTDNQAAAVRMSSLAGCALLRAEGLEPVLQVVVRDRNRIALQSDILGASALGIRNVLCLSGDHPCFGNQPQAAGVFDLDSIQWIQALRQMRDQAVLVGGEPLERPPEVFIGAAANPFADPAAFRPVRLAKKIAAGAEFIQTQCIYNLERFAAWLEAVQERGLAGRACILGGVTPLKSAGMARFMRARVAGMDIPDAVIQRMEGVPVERQRAEGIRIAVETIGRLKEMQGVSGVHVMAIEWEEAVEEILEGSGLLPRPETGPGAAKRDAAEIRD